MPSPVCYPVVHRAMTRAGWVLDRIAGSHHIYKRGDGSEGVISIPVHKGLVKHGYLKKIKALGVDIDD